MENTPLIKFIRNYIRDPSGVFLISSLVRILMMSFPAFSQLFVQTVSENGAGLARVFFCVYNKKKIAWRREDMHFIFSS